MIRGKRRLLGMVCVGALLLGLERGVEAAGITVFDPANLEENIQQLAQDIKNYGLQLAQYATQTKQFIGEQFSWLAQYHQLVTQTQQYFVEGMQLLNFAHHPTFGGAMGLMNQAGLGNALPFNPYSAMNLINGSSYGGGIFSQVQGLMNQLSNFSGAAYQQNAIYVPQDGSWQSDQVIANGNSVAAAQGMAMAAYDDYRNHQAVLPALRENAAAADTMKDAADTQNQIAIETVWNLGQLGQVNAMQWMAAQQREARVQRDEERLTCELEQWRAAVPRPCPKGNNAALAGGGGGANGGSVTVQAPPAQPLTGVGGNPIAMQPPVPAPPQAPPQPPAFEAAPPPPGGEPAQNPQAN